MLLRQNKEDIQSVQLNLFHKVGLLWLL